MSNVNLERKQGRRRVWILYLFCIAGFLAWLSFTPDGLLGKADSIGFAVCHRIPARSFDIDGRPLPLCARCSGMYLGAVGGILFQLAAFRRRAGLPGWKTGIPFILFVLAFAVDGLNSYVHLFPGVTGIYEPGNLGRLITGTGMGISIAAILVPAFHQTVWRVWDPRTIFTGWKNYAGLIGAGYAISTLILVDYSPLRYLLAILSVYGVILILSVVYTMLWMMVFRKDNQAEKWVQLLPWLAAGFLTAMIQIGLTDYLRYLVFGSWSGFSF